MLCILRAVRCGLTGPAEAQLFCYVYHLLVCLVCAAQRAWRRQEGHSFSCVGPCTRVGRGKECWLQGSCSPVGTALPCRQDQGTPQGKGSCHERKYDRVSPAFPLRLGTPSAGGESAWTVPAGCVPKLVSLRMLYRSRRDNGVSVLLRSSLPLPCESGEKSKGHQLEKRAAALPWHHCFSRSPRVIWHGHVEQPRKKSCQRVMPPAPGGGMGPHCPLPEVPETQH